MHFASDLFLYDSVTYAAITQLLFLEMLVSAALTPVIALLRNENWQLQTG